MKRTKWFDREFPPFRDNGLLPTLIERLAGTPARVDEIIRQTPADLQILKPGGKWSICEEIGHLSDLEPLWLGRVDDLVNRLPELRAADLSNKKTHEANHNAADMNILAKRFREQRMLFVTSLRNISDQQLLFSSLHPRLKTPMRIIDLAYFVAEHDDHHLAAISELQKLSSQSKNIV